MKTRLSRSSQRTSDWRCISSFRRSTRCWRRSPDSTRTTRIGSIKTQGTREMGNLPSTWLCRCPRCTLLWGIQCSIPRCLCNHRCRGWTTIKGSSRLTTTCSKIKGECPIIRWEWWATIWVKEVKVPAIPIPLINSTTIMRITRMVCDYDENPSRRRNCKDLYVKFCKRDLSLCCVLHNFVSFHVICMWQFEKNVFNFYF